jgi:CspA family cold shock protein
MGGGTVSAAMRGTLTSPAKGRHMATLNGTVKRLVSDKGFGFVADTNGSEYFFHQSACAQFDAMHEGQNVTFEAGQGPKGPRAENVRVV